MYSRQRVDPYPRIRPAGQAPFGTDDTVDHCVRQDIHLNQMYDQGNGRPQTPEHIRKYRASTNGQPGVRQVHPGMAEDVQNIDFYKAYGVKTNRNEQLETVLKAQNMQGLADKFNDIREDKYSSHVREPLGKTYVRGHNLPSQTQQDWF